MRRLEAEAALEPLVIRVNEALDLVEQHPGSAEARRLRFVDPPSWGIPVGYGEHSYVITWISGEDFAARAGTEDVAALSEAIGNHLGEWAIVLYVGPRPQ
jgi:hypothetical protein